MNDTLPARDGNVPAAVQDLIDDAALAEFEDLADTLGLTEEQAQAVWDWIVEGALRFVGDFLFSRRLKHRLFPPLPD